MFGNTLVEFCELLLDASSMELCAVANVGARIERTAMEQPSSSRKSLANVALETGRFDLLKILPQFWQKFSRFSAGVVHLGHGVCFCGLMDIFIFRSLSDNPRTSSIPRKISTNPAIECTMSAVSSPSQ